MKTATSLVLALLFLACQAQREEEKIELGEMLDEFRFQQLQLIPVRANKAFLERNAGQKYLTLNEAVKTKKVTITERNNDEAVQYQQPASLEETPVVQEVIEGEGAQVNSLFVENTSEDTVLILGGEVVEGGNQDRTIAQDVILPPHSGKIDLSVFCVEHGRWSGEGDMFMVAEESLAPAKVRKAAIEVADQQEVWDEVALKLEVNRASSATQALTELKEQTDYTRKQAEYVAALAVLFNDDESVIGVIAVAGGEIIGAEMFASHELFTRYYPNLLQSWAGEAVNAEPTSLDPAVVKEFFKSSVEVKAKEAGLVGTGRRVLHVSVF